MRDSPTNSARAAARAAKDAAPLIAKAPSAEKNALLSRFSGNLRARADVVLAANRLDMEAAGALPESLKDRLHLDEKRVQTMADGIDAVAALPDPIGETGGFCVRPSGIRVGKMRVPLGVLFAVYESRPNVTADIAALALKSGNAVILRGGREARHSNAAIGECLAAALKETGFPAAAQVAADAPREFTDELLSCEEIDLAVPRGGRGLIERVAEKARMPVLKHLDGNCHVYVDAAADLEMAEKIVVNAKTRRFGVCSAAESLLVHQDIAAAFCPRIFAALAARGVEIRGCEAAQKIAAECGATNMSPASEDDWGAEYLAPVISLKIVSGTGEAVSHIARYGSGHTDAVVTDSVSTGRRFLREVDSSSVMLNASTAFADGGEYGLGAEVGISTGKFHARGPVGLLGLTSEKYIVVGDGAVRS